ncbi:HIT domain-containing protein [Patescibacteria group bacterium]|nr:HIT domain-containing protein [Patescibacteria group bacterium]
MNNCIFCKIRDGKIPKDFTYEDDYVMVFPDIKPLKPVHLLIVPKKHVTEFLELSDDLLTVKLREIIKKMIKQEGLSNRGYRFSINGGGYQLVNHLHIHLLGPMS